MTDRDAQTLTLKPCDVCDVADVEDGTLCDACAEYLLQRDMSRKAPPGPTKMTAEVATDDENEIEFEYNRYDADRERFCAD